MPLPAWILLVAAIGLGLSLELAFYRARRRERRQGAAGAASDVATSGHDSGGRA